MAIGRTNVGGGGGLNFSVKAYVSESSLPSTASENTISVITDTAITGWIADVKKPEGQVDGIVWIKVSAESEVPFNATRRNVLAIYPVSVLQYTNGEFANMDAFIFQNGTWVQFSSKIEYLYKNGKTSLTWKGTGTDTDTELVMGVIHTSYKGGYGDYGRKYTDKPIKIPIGFTKLSIKYYCTGTKQTEGTPTHAFVLRTDLTPDTWMSGTNVVASVSIPYSKTETVATIDITGSLYGQQLYVGTYYNSHKNIEQPKKYHIKEIWFE